MLINSENDHLPGYQVVMLTKRIYCSGPLFCAEEVGGMRAIAKVLETAGWQTFLPHRDGIESYIMRFVNVPLPQALAGVRGRIDYAIFALDVYELLERCSAVVCNLNGRVPDEGMVVEAALAYAAGQPLVLFKDDARAPFNGCDNAMLTCLGQGKLIRKLNELPLALDASISRVKTEVRLSSDLQQALACGKRIASAMEQLPTSFGKQKWSEEVIRQVITAAFDRE